MDSIPEIKSGVNERLREACPNTDLSQEPPINQKRLVTFINHFVISIVEFVDKFSRHCTTKLFIFDQKINKIEAELCLLESKLNSIPEIADKKDVDVVLPKPEELETQTIQPPVEKDTSLDAPPETSEENKEAESFKEDPVKEEENPALVKYRKMVQVGVPVTAVKIKMKVEGLDPNLLDS